MVLLENTINSLIALSPDKFNFEVALVIMDLMVLDFIESTDAR